MIWFIIILISCLAIFLWPGIKALIATIEDLQDFPAHLLKRGFNGGSLTIRVIFSKKYIRLKKYIYSNENYGIALHFPNVKWSCKYYQKLLDYCLENKISFKILIIRDVDFLYVDFRKDSKAAYRLIKTIVLDIFNLDRKVKLSFELKNVHLKDELVNDPDI